MLHINDIVFRIGDRLLFDGATVSLPAKARAGLVGRNGAGKTTLFRLIAGELGTERGAISLPRRARVGQVAQEAPDDARPLIEVVMAADTERVALLAEAETATDGHRIAEIQTRLIDIDAHSAEARAATILAGLGFDTVTQGQPCAELSGGWRMRVALAATLFAQPDLLLLDEPTNYLDLEGTLWLDAYLARYPYGFIVISHDRDLLNSAVDTIVHLDGCKLTPYRGGYDSFDRQRRERQALQLRLKKKQDDQRRHMEAFVERFRYKASKAKQAQSRLKALQKLQPIAALADDSLAAFTFPAPQKPAKPPLVDMSDAAAAYGDGPPVLRDLNLRIDDDDRIGLLGANGNGKSTLAKLIAGRLTATAGRVKRHHRLEVAYFAQHQLDELDPAASPYQQVRARLPEATEAQVRARAGGLGFGAGKMDTPAEKLSGGEKARLLLGLATFDGPHVMILDEPTNHLDVDNREALVRALADYPGAVILISHDRHLLEATADRLWLVADGTVVPYEGDLDDYRRDILASRGAASGRRDRSSPARSPGAERRRAAAKAREKTASLRKKISETEHLIESLHKEIQTLDAALADASTNAAADRIVQLSRKRAEAADRLSAAEDAWLSLSQQLAG